MTEIIVCSAHYDIQEIDRQDCPTCKSKQPFLCQHEDWYGWTTTCLNCGDTWMDGELRERPFMKGWRKLAIKKVQDKAISLGLSW